MDDTQKGGSVESTPANLQPADKSSFDIESIHKTVFEGANPCSVRSKAIKIIANHLNMEYDAFIKKYLAAKVEGFHFKLKQLEKGEDYSIQLMFFDYGIYFTVEEPAPSGGGKRLVRWAEWALNRETGVWKAVETHNVEWRAGETQEKAAERYALDVCDKIAANLFWGQQLGVFEVEWSDSPEYQL